MSWKEYILERFRIKERNASLADRKAEEAIDRGDKERAKAKRHQASRNENYIGGMLEVLESIGYTINFDDDANVKSIDGEFAQEYRVRYRNDRFTNAIICMGGSEVQTVIDRLKATSLRNPEYKFEGIDSRVIYPNGECSGWNKIYDV